MLHYITLHYIILYHTLFLLYGSQGVVGRLAVSKYDFEKKGEQITGYSISEINIIY